MSIISKMIECETISDDDKKDFFESCLFSDRDDRPRSLTAKMLWKFCNSLLTFLDMVR